MDDKKAQNILIKLLDKRILSREEEEAVNKAIRVFDWMVLSHSRIKAMGKARRAKLEKSLE